MFKFILVVLSVNNPLSMQTIEFEREAFCKDAQIELAFHYTKNGWLNFPNFEFEKDGERIVLLCLADKQRKRRKKAG